MFPQNNIRKSCTTGAKGERVIYKLVTGHIFPHSVSILATFLSNTLCFKYGQKLDFYFLRFAHCKKECSILSYVPRLTF